MKRLYVVHLIASADVYVCADSAAEAESIALRDGGDELGDSDVEADEVREVSEMPRFVDAADLPYGDTREIATALEVADATLAHVHAWAKAHGDPMIAKILVEKDGEDDGEGDYFYCRVCAKGMMAVDRPEWMEDQDGVVRWFCKPCWATLLSDKSACGVENHRADT